MCGINGIFSYSPSTHPVDKDELVAIRDSMFVRGPDGCGVWVSDDYRIGLAHRRLSIIDLSSLASQPMSTPDQQIFIVFNGEIYNYKYLRKKLVEKGVNFKTHSDTEVLLYLYKEFGEEMVYHLRGMFSFVIWDNKNDLLFLAKDPYGIKPLYYVDDDEQFRFASQVKALEKDKRVSHSLDPAGVVGFFLWGSVPEPFSIYEDIKALPAGCTMKVSNSGLEGPKQYWNIRKVIARSCEMAKTIPFGQERDCIREALLDSVKHHMVSDVKVGAFLSAGLDSSTIVGLAVELGLENIDTVTLSFDEFTNKQIDELPLAIEIAKHFGVKHNIIKVNLQTVEDELSKYINAMDQPTVDGFNTWFISKAAAEYGLKVVLSGVGGDELLGGYSTFQSITKSIRKLAHFDNLPLLGDAYRLMFAIFLSKSKHADPRQAGLFKLGGNYPGAYQLQRGLFMPWELHHVLDKEFVKLGLERLRHAKLHDKCNNQDSLHLNSFGRIVELESSRYMRNQLLRDTDWTGMAHSLEIRVPLVDHVLTEKVVGLAATGRLGGNKSMLPLVLKKRLPENVISRPKTGFTVPLWRWMHQINELRAWKQHPFLCRPNTSEIRRWAYTLMTMFHGTEYILKNQLK